MKYFVMLNKWNGHTGIPIPLIDGVIEGDDDPALFDTEEQAERAAEENMLGKAYGYEVYTWSYDTANEEGG